MHALNSNDWTTFTNCREVCIWKVPSTLLKVQGRYTKGREGASRFNILCSQISSCVKAISNSLSNEPGFNVHYTFNHVKGVACVHSHDTWFNKNEDHVKKIGKSWNRHLLVFTFYFNTCKQTVNLYWNAFGKLSKVKHSETVRYMSKWVFLHKYDWVEFYI